MSHVTHVTHVTRHTRCLPWLLTWSCLAPGSGCRQGPPRSSSRRSDQSPCALAFRHRMKTLFRKKSMIICRHKSRYDPPREGLCPHPVDGAGKVAVGDGCISRLYWPHRLWQASNRGARSEEKDYLMIETSFHIEPHYLGLKTISAPLTPYIIQFWGWWRP